MEFNLAEKLAIVKAIDMVILANGKIDEGEILYLEQLMKALEFGFEFVQEARKFNATQAKLILQGMSESKKQALSHSLYLMASADGDIDEKELETINSIFMAVGIDIENAANTKPPFDVSDVYFESSEHILYEKGKPKSGPFGKARRAIKIETDMEGIEEYSVTSYNLDDIPALWGNNIQMTSKQMKVIESEPTKTVLRGYGEDPVAMGHPDGVFSNYGISIIHPNNKIEKIVLHRYDRSEDTEYLK